MCQPQQQLNYYSDIGYSIWYIDGYHTQIYAHDAMLYSPIRKYIIYCRNYDEVRMPVTMHQTCPTGEWNITYISFITENVVEYQIFNGDEIVQDLVIV